MKKLAMFTAALSAFAAQAAVTLGAPFSDGMVLQRGRSVPVWGWADAGESVMVAFAGQKLAATAGADGKWRVDLAPMEATKEGRTLEVNGVKAESYLWESIYPGTSRFIFASWRTQELYSAGVKEEDINSFSFSLEMMDRDTFNVIKTENVSFTLK